MIPLLRLSPRGWFVVALVVVASLIGYRVGHKTARVPSVGHNVAIAETLYVAAKARTDTVRVTIREQVVRWQVDTLWRSDTVTVNDTVRVLIPAPTLARMDSTIRACATLDTLVTRERSACERVQQALRDSIRTLQPSRFGCVAGVGVTANQHRATPGVGVTCGLRMRR